MIKKTKSKDFDCVQSKKEAQQRIHERTKGMTWKEEVEHYRKTAESGPFTKKMKDHR
jgi:hypothetical protein